MADGQQQSQKSPEKQNPQTSGDSLAKAELLKKAQEKFAKTDVGGDGKDDSKDSEYRKLALSFVQKECLNLPDDRFQKLVEKITEVLKRKNLEKSGLETEFKHVREEISKEVSSSSKAPAVEAHSVQPSKLDAKIGKFRAGMNSLMDKAGYDREILRQNFNPENLNRVEIESSANYMEYVAKTWGVEFMDDVRKNPDRLIGFCKHWSPDHPVYKELVSRNEPETAKRIETLRVSFSSNFGLDSYLKKKSPTEAETETEKARLWKILDTVNKAVAFGKIKQQAEGTALNKDSKVSVSKEFLKTIVDGSHDDDLQAFKRRVQSDIGMATTLVFDWKDTHPVYTALLTDNTPESKKALSLIAELKTNLQNRVGLQNPGNSKEKRGAFEKLLKQDVENIKKWEEIDAKSKTFEAILSDKLRTFKELSKSGSDELIAKEKKALITFTEQSINPLIDQANGLLGMLRPGTEQYKRQQEIHLKLSGRRLAAEYLIAEDWSGGIWGSLNDKTLTIRQSSLNKEAEKRAREEAFENNLKGKVSFQTYSKEKNNYAKTFEAFEIEIIAADAKGTTLRELNSNDLFGYLKWAYAIGRLSGPYLMQILPKTALQNALHYGIKNGKIDRSFQSETMKRLMVWTPYERDVAKSFQNALLYVVDQQVSNEKIDKIGFPALKKFMEDHGNGAKFESVKAKLEKADGWMQNVEALMEALGASSRDPKSVEKFIDVDLPTISKEIGNDLQAKIDQSKASCVTRYPQVMTVQGAGITPLRLKTTGSDNMFLEGIFLKRLESLTLDEAKNLERLVKSTLAKAGKNKLDYETQEFLRDQLTPLEALIRMKKVQKQHDQVSVLADISKKGTPKQKEEMKAAILDPEDKKKVAKFEAKVESGVKVKEADREAKREEALQKNDPENRRALEEIAIALWYGSLNEILSDETKSTKAWYVFISQSEKFEKMPGYEEFKKLFEKKFLSIYFKKVDDGTDDEFFKGILKDINKEDKNVREKRDAEKWDSASEAERQIRLATSENVANSAWSKSFFKAETGDYESSSFLEKVPVGEKISISAGYTVERTATGVEFKTPDGNWKVDGQAAEGAVAVAKTLHSIGADFLISSIEEIAASEDVKFRDGTITQEEGKKLFVFMADFFGVKSFDKNEPDIKVMKEKFIRATEAGGRSLKERGRDIGIVSENGSLIDTKLQERIATFHTYRNREAKSARKEIPNEAVAA